MKKEDKVFNFIFVIMSHSVLYSGLVVACFYIEDKLIVATFILLIIKDLITNYKLENLKDELKQIKP